MLGLIKLLLTLCLLLGLAACGRQSETKDLDHYLAQVKQKPPSPIPSLPALQTYTAHTYSVDTMRSPFQIEANQMQHADSDLVDYQLNNIKMVGVVYFGSKPWALIALPNGRVERVTIGELLGASYGTVTAITDTGLTVVETTVIAGKTLSKKIELPLSVSNP